MVSTRQKGKQRAVDQNDNAAGPSRDGAGDEMAVDHAEAAHGPDGSPRRRQEQQQHTPIRSSKRKTEDAFSIDDASLGSSVSRSARMRMRSAALALDTDHRGSRRDEDGQEHSSGSDDSSSSSSSDSEGDEAADTLRDLTTRETDSKNDRTRGRSFVTASEGEAYLRAMARPAKTSNKKLSEDFHVSQAYTQAAFVDSLAKSAQSSRAKAVEMKLSQLEEAYDTLHSQWLLELQQGFSILLYGLGSKIRVLNRFVERCLKKQRTTKKQAGLAPGQRGKAIVINGFMAALGVDDILKALEAAVMPATSANELADDHFLSGPGSGKSAAKLDERTKAIIVALNSALSAFSATRTIYLVIHNIDGIALRSFRAQAILSILASQPQIRLIATIDHVKAPLLFPTSLASGRPSSVSSLARPNGRRQGQEEEGLEEEETRQQDKRGYNFIYHHAPSHRPYTIESLVSGTMASILPPTIFLPDAMTGSGLKNGGDLSTASSESRAKAAFFVLASLPQKAKDVFVLLAERQMSLVPGDTPASTKATVANGGGTAEMPRAPSYASHYSTIFAMARDRFLANNVAQFEALMREFRDHNVILASNVAPDEIGISQDADDEGNAEEEEVGSRGSEWIWIAIDKEDLEELVEKLGAGGGHS